MTSQMFDKVAYNKAYYWKNRDKAIAAARDWNEKNRDYRLALKRKNDLVRFTGPENWLRRKLYNTRHHSRKRGVEFAITAQDITLPEFCPVLGIRLDYSTGKSVGRNNYRDNGPSLDRIDNSKGYIPGNVQVISWRANNLKSNGTLEEMRAIVRYMEQFLS